MTPAVSDFSSVIVEYTITTEDGPGQKRVERGKITFIDGSRLVTYESRKGSRFKYGYQWMNTVDETIFRWDNTPHFPEFDTFPNHRHVGADEVAEPHAFVSLIDVLTIIVQRITSG